MSANSDRSDGLLEADVIGAAVRYAAVGDWFENRPVNRREKDRDREAMDVFNRVEAEVRQAGRRLLRRMGHRELVLKQTLAESGIENPRSTSDEMAVVA